MKIKNLVIYFLKKKISSIYPVPSFYKDGFIIIKLIDQNNNCGLGEPSPYFLDHKLIIRDISKLYKKFFIHKNILSLNTESIKKEISNNNLKKLVSCFDQAILDLKAKNSKISIPQYLSKKKNFDGIDLYASGGMIYESQSYSKAIDEAIKFSQLGFFGYKFRPKLPNKFLSHNARVKKPPEFNAEELIKFAKIMRDETNSQFKLMVDLGCRGQSIKKVNYIIDALDDLDFYFVEEPLKRNIKLYKFLKKKRKIKIAGGEHISNLDMFEIYRKNKIFDIFQPDTNLLLFSEIKKILNKLNNERLILHNWCNLINFASNISCALSLQKKILVEYNINKNPYNKFFNNSNYFLNKGKIYFKKKQGFGIKLNYKQSNLIKYEKKI